MQYKQQRNSNTSHQSSGVSHGPLSNICASFRPSGGSTLSGTSSTRINVAISNYLRGTVNNGLPSRPVGENKISQQQANPFSMAEKQSFIMIVDNSHGNISGRLSDCPSQNSLLEHTRREESMFKHPFRGRD